MSDKEHFARDFSAHRLQGEALPDDLARLVAHRSELERLTGIALNASPAWAPWLDTSYLRERDWADPAIRANVKAISEVCQLIDFVVADEDRNYLGYWRGPARLPLAQAHVVSLDNEGQFYLCGTTSIAGAILTSAGQFETLRSWLVGIGIVSLPSGPYDLLDMAMPLTPKQVHDRLFDQYLAEERAA